ncbi:MAG: PVC-type heme-binding CxxCH protein [Verrucomicrobiota bacterium]
MKTLLKRFLEAGFCAALCAPLFLPPALASDAAGLRALFLGDNGHHRPADRFKQIQPVLSQRQIVLEYTDKLTDLNPQKLAGFDCVVVYANHTQISSAQEKALLDFVAAGGGFVPLHCASYCFLNSPKYIELVGAQFKSHGTGVFKEMIVDANHPIMKGLEPIESWDETYVHAKHNSDRVVLAERRHEQGAEPWTWVREHGKGRVFYTAWGHDQRTWSHAGFHALVERGIRWASANSPTQLKVRTGLKPFEYVESPVPLPNYTPNAQWGTQGEPIRTMQKPLEPAESMKHLVTFPEFDFSLFASEPEIIKPLWLAWDQRGRLWIAESVDYPNELQNEGEGRDRLKICEDTNGDGRADKFTVFVDKLSIPTGFVFANDGVIVIHSGRTELFKDTNGDDKADERRVLFTGWSMRDTHATASNLRYGFDGWIWGTVGYSGFQGTVGGKEIRFGQGIFRFNPDGSQMEFVRSSNNNTWGLGITEDNIIIGSTANGNASMYMPIPNRFYEAVNGWSASRLESIADSQSFFPITDKVRQVDWHGRYTAGSGSAIYTARDFPKEYWNRVQFVAEPTGHLLGKFHLQPQGADYIAHNGRNFVASDDEWSSPIYAEVGPDGALWMVDWYNYIIQHNPTPRGFRTGKGAAYETPLRDKDHGRIYRITYSASATRSGNSASMPQLNPSHPQSLVEALQNNNLLWRMHAQRLLVERGQSDVVPALCKLVQNHSVDEIGLNVGAIHALWTLHGLGALSTSNSEACASARAALKHPSAAVRRAAVMTLPRQSDLYNAMTEAKLLNDPDAQVRLATFLALAEIPAFEAAGQAVLAALQEARNSEDRWIPDAATAAAAKHDAAFLRAVLASYKPVAPAPASASSSATPSNLISNGSFENVTNDRPNDWRSVTHSGRGEFALTDTARTGKRSVKISSEQGGDLSWAVRVPVNPGTDYRLTGWIKTENVRKIGNARGAMFNIHELQDPVRGGTKALTGDNDWTEVQLTFNSGQMREITVNCLFGGWGRTTGTAWFDDVMLTPAPGSELAGAIGRVVRIVTAHYAVRGPVDSIVATLSALNGASASLSVAILDGLVSGWPEGLAPEIGEREKQTLSSLMTSMPESVRDRLLALAQRWGRTDIFGANIAGIIQGLKTQIADGATPEAQRIAAARRLIGLDSGSEMVKVVLDQVNLLTPPALASGLVGALTESRDTGTGAALVTHWNQMTPAVKRAAIATLMRRGEWTRALLDAVDKGTIARTDLAAEHWSQLKQNPNPMIARRAERLSTPIGGISSDREEIVKKLLPLAKEKGDAARGKEVYVANCAVCHLFNGQGGKVGPDLSGIGSRDRADILLEILDPNRSVEANYRLWSVATKDGETYSGRLDAETQTSVELLDTTGQKHVVQRKDISKLEASQLSIMPTGFEMLPPDDLKALLEFLAQPHP